MCEQLHIHGHVRVDVSDLEKIYASTQRLVDDDVDQWPLSVHVLFCVMRIFNEKILKADLQ